MSAGLATFLLLWPLAEFELKSDQYHKNSDRVFRVGVDWKWTDDNENWNGFLGAWNWLGVAHEIEQTFPQVEGAGFMSPQEAVGKKVLLGDNKNEVEIIGVFGDYEFRPFFMDVREEGRGIALTYKDFLIPKFKPLKFSIKIDMQNFETELESLTDLYTNTFQEPFKWFFLEEKIKMYYANEQATKNQIAFFSLLAIGIACLGLLGMISNKAVEKTKEIGIRKILGAGMLNIARLLLTTTAKQIIIANIIGIPLAYYLVTQYLQKFSERLALQWWHYAIPVLLFMIIMLVTIVSVLFKASRTNPTESLRYE